MITYRLSAVPLPGPGYVKRSPTGATIVLNRAKFTREQAAALTALSTAATDGAGLFAFWDGEIVPWKRTPEADLPLEQPVQ